jgi:transposase
LSRKARSVAQGWLTMDACFVGVDVSKDRLDVHVLPSGEFFHVTRDGAGIETLSARLSLLSISHIGVEATGGFETIVAAGLVGAGLPVVVINPAQIRHFAKALGERAKTDPVDARVIAQFVAATRPEIRMLADEATQRLSDLVARRRQIVEMRVSEGQRLKRARDQRLIKSIGRLVKALEIELAEIDKDIDDSVRGSPAWRDLEDLLTTVKGVGQVTARTLMAEFPELGRLTGGQAAALAGLAPFTRQSGQWKGKACIGGGRAVVRTILFTSAQIAKRHNPVLKAFYDRLIAAGKPKMVATIADARNLIDILNGIAKSRKPWQFA